MSIIKQFLKQTLILFSFSYSFHVIAQTTHLDNSFGVNGSIIKNLSDAKTSISDALEQPDGKLVIAGGNFNGIQTNVIIIRYNSNGSLDNTFGNNGKVVTQFNNITDYAYALGLQSNGKIVIAGIVSNGTYNDLGMARYNSDGTLDNTFGVGGKITFSLSGNIAVTKLAFQSDGKIVLAGTSYVGMNSDVLLMRFGTNGSIDNTFGNNGIVATDVDNFSSDEGKCLAINSSGKIIIGATTNSGFDTDCALLMYDNTGNLDLNFANNGILIRDVSGIGMPDVVSDIKITGFNKIVIAGHTDIGNFNQDMYLSRYESNGNLDYLFGNGGTNFFDNASGDDKATALSLFSNGDIIITGNTSSISSDYLTAKCDSLGNILNSFGNNGYVVTDLTGDQETAAECIVLNNGNIIVAGNTNQNIGIVKYSSNGVLDATFGNNGKIVDHVGNAVDDAIKVLLQVDGKILTLSKIFDGMNYGVAVLRQNSSSGTDDSGFGVNGMFKLFMSNNSIEPKSMALQQDGKIVITGMIKDDYNTLYDFITIRINANGTIDNTFGTNGIVQTDYSFSSYDQANAIAIQSDGSVVISGVTGVGFALIRYNSVGVLDNTFGTNGKVYTTIGSYYSVVKDMILQADGKVIVVGNSYNGTNNDIVLVRYNIDGNIDNTFGTSGIVTSDILNIDNTITAVKIQSDGKIVVSGNNYNGTFNDMLLVRYSANGTIDNTFNTNGFVVSGLLNNDYANDLLIQSDGNIIAAGSSYDGTNTKLAMLRYSSTGTIDNTFGVNGLVTTLIPEHAAIRSVVVDNANSKIIAFGDILTGNEKDIVLLKYYQEAQTIGVREEQKNILLSVYPNPSKGEFNLKFSEQVNSLYLKVYNSVGEIVLEKVYSDTDNLSVSCDLPKGIYLMTVKTEHKDVSAKIVID